MFPFNVGLSIKKNTNLDEGLYKICILQVAFPLSSMDYQKSIKLVTSVRPIISSRGSVTYEVAKILTKVLKPLVDKSPIINKVPATL